jgi:aconitase B
MWPNTLRPFDSSESATIMAGWRRALNLHFCRKSFGSQRRLFATVVEAHIPQTFIEKVVQRYALGLAPGQTVKAGDYVMIRPEHVMSHDNTGPVISK